MASSNSERHSRVEREDLVKRHSNLFDKIIDRDNLYIAFTMARKGKRWQRKVRRVEQNIDEYLDRLHDELESGTYHTSAYKTKVIYEPKERTIYILPFYPDRIVHHAVMLVLEPIWDKLMYFHSYSCRKGKGQHKGSTLCMEYARRYKYVLKCDVSKFYPSVNHEILKRIIRRKIKDKRLLNLLDEIIDSADGETNVPIGNYLSQWFGNLYLNELDTFVKHDLRVKPYIRYCDDFVLFSNDKTELHEWARQIEHYLASSLELKLSKCNVFPVAQGIDFLGYRHFPQKILCRKRTAKRMKRHVKETMHLLNTERITHEQAESKLASVHGWIKHAQVYNLRQTLDLDELIAEVKAERSNT